MAGMCGDIGWQCSLTYHVLGYLKGTLHGQVRMGGHIGVAVQPGRDAARAAAG